ncbi:AtpZ/AtpI family protein [Aquimarina sp. 2201CG1-2-11]|uniref:AtpZ/AtpI family protein n=1 Tax=Aquimarina discodermiae TaxID=3231043 RepID=UPI003462841A
MKDKNRDKKSLNKYIALTGIAFQMGATIFLAAYAGKKLDAHYQYEKQWFTMVFVILGVVVSLYMVIKQLDRINRPNK